MKDYIPRGVDEFSVWLGVLAREVAVHGAALGIEPAEIAALEADAARFAAELAGAVAAKNAYRKALSLRDKDRKATITPRVRDIVGRMQRHPAMRDYIREGMGITVPDKTPTRLSDRFIRELDPPLLNAFVGVAKQVTLRFGHNPENQRNNGLPFGMRGVRLWYCVGDTPPHDEKDWIFLDDCNRSPYVHELWNSEMVMHVYRAAFVDKQNRVGAPSYPVRAYIHP